MDLVAYEELTGKKLEDKRENWRGLCPIHEEKTPSFYIHKETYLCHCFGCGVSGYLDNVLGPIVREPRLVVREKLKIPILLTSLIQQHERAEVSFNKAYLAAFKRVSMHPFLKKRGFKSETIVLAGTRWDHTSKRIVFPITSIADTKIRGAVGRATRSTDEKWYFYWDTRRGEILYQPIDTLRVDIIVEGILDCLWLFQYGFTGAVALLGSKATKKQVELIKQNTNEVILFLDNDEAGRIGQAKLAKELKDSVKVYFVKYPESKNDPQELTEDELRHAIMNRETYIEYYSCR